eukprot:TRINITY_DN663_c0_g1_i1.p1 TRINITY_DN663_c0_g1~~TRINITY_DN663_c0_g1_i1.p1  ORF type:complete len:129 (+),score=19.35 TRINITY_DN663_c0_g1_i1:196-582(+)
MTQCGCKRQPHLGNKGRWISKKDFKLLKMIFVAYDTDDSGSVTYQEFQKRFSDNPELNVTMLPSMANIFEQLDGDHNGEMTFRELLAAYYPGTMRPVRSRSSTTLSTNTTRAAAGVNSRVRSMHTGGS